MGKEGQYPSGPEWETGAWEVIANHGGTHICVNRYRTKRRARLAAEAMALDRHRPPLCQLIVQKRA